jgi:hypothetical protein
VLAKRIQLRVRSIKVSGWIGSRESNLSRGFSRKDARHKKEPIDSKILQGASCKTATSSSSSGQTAQAHRKGAAAALVTSGVGAPGDEKLGRGTKRIEGIETNTMGGSPRAEDDGAGRILRSTVAVWFRRRRLELLCRAAARLAGRRRRRAAQQGA